MKTILALAALLASPAHGTAKNTKTDGGRFQIIQLSDARRDQYMLDTQTGRIWLRVCVKASGDDCAVPAWRFELVEGINISQEKLDKVGQD